MNINRFPGGWAWEFGPFLLHWRQYYDVIFSLIWETGWFFWVECGRYTCGFDPLWFRR